MNKVTVFHDKKIAVVCNSIGRQIAEWKYDHLDNDTFKKYLDVDLKDHGFVNHIETVGVHPNIIQVFTE